jgi:large subunit ribosomal protein L18e
VAEWPNALGLGHNLFASKKLDQKWKKPSGSVPARVRIPAPALLSWQDLKRVIKFLLFMKTNPETVQLISNIEKNIEKTNSNFWKRILKELKKTKQSRREVNIQDLNRHTKKDDVVIVPGKVLGNGELEHEITLTSFNVSESAMKKLKKAKVMPLAELLKKNPEGKGVRIIG